MNSDKEHQDSPPLSSDGRLELSSDRESNYSQETIQIDYLNDLERQIAPEELKAFILQQLNEQVLLPKDVLNLIEEGAELNRFTDISEDVKDLLV